MLRYDDKAAFASFMREDRYNMDDASLESTSSDFPLAGLIKSETGLFGKETFISEPCIPKGLPISIDSFLDRQTS